MLVLTSNALRGRCVNFTVFRRLAGGIVILGAVAGPAAFPDDAGGSGTIALSGIRGAICSITVNGGSSASVGNLNVGGTVTDQTVATVLETCNYGSGYDVTISTLNGTSSGPQLRGASSAELLDYTVKYGGGGLAFVNKSATVSYSSATTSAGSARPLQISFGAKDLAADTYSDTLTLTIAAH